MGEWKLLLPFGKETIIEAAVHTALAACPRVILVSGYRGGELAAAFQADQRVLVVENPDWPTGMLGSILRGVPLIETSRFFVALGDMPLLCSEVYAALLGQPVADAVLPVFHGARGHPVLLKQSLGEKALRNPPASGRMKDLLARHDIREMPWPDDSVLRDINTPEDYACLTKR